MGSSRKSDSSTSEKGGGGSDHDVSPSSPVVKRSYRGRAFRAAMWKSTKDKVSSGKVDLDLLIGCPVLKPPRRLSLGGGIGGGKHKWTVRILDAGGEGGVRLGVASHSHDLAFTRAYGDNRVGEQRYTWGCTSAGRAIARCHEGLNFSGIAASPSFKTGSTVKLTLDLSGTGTLSISVDGAPAAQVFENMKAPFEDPKKDVAFVPAASLGDGARIELVGFK